MVEVQGASGGTWERRIIHSMMESSAKSVKPAHWTYARIETDQSDIQQGDIIQLSGELRVVFDEVHPHFTDDKYSAFLVLTQTCDMVRVKGEPRRSRYINLAVIRPVADVLGALLDRTCEKAESGDEPIPGVYLLESKYKAKHLLERIFNQNAQGDGLFYLYPDLRVGISEHSVALLQVSVALRAHEHYEKLVRARSGRLAHQFQSKLGWLIGNLFSRVATQDWEDAQVKLMSEKLLGSKEVPGCTFHWVPRDKANKARKQHSAELRTMTPQQAAAFINQLEGRPRELAVEGVLEAVREVVPGVSPGQLKSLKERLETDAVFAAACK